MFGYRKRQELIIKMGIFSAILTTVFSGVLFYMLCSIKNNN
jgi:hypothetical protein